MLTHRDIGLDLGWDEYVKLPGLNHSLLATLGGDDGSPLRFRHRQQAPQPDKDAFRLGRALHTAVLEPHRLPLDLAVWDGLNPETGQKTTRSSNAYKAWKAQHAERTEVSADEYARIVQQAKALTSHPLAAPYFADFVAERTVAWTDPATGQRCKRRVDLITTHPAAQRGASLVTVADVKTARTINERLFARDLHRYGYHTAAAHTIDGLSVVTGIQREWFRYVLLVVTSAEPYDVLVGEVGTMSLDLGRATVADWLATVKRCSEADQWPGMYDAEQVLDVPVYAMPDPDDDITTEED